MQRTQDMAIETMMEQLIANGSEDMASVFAGLFDLAMRIERERFLVRTAVQKLATEVA